MTGDFKITRHIFAYRVLWKKTTQNKNGHIFVVIRTYTTRFGHVKLY